VKENIILKSFSKEEIMLKKLISIITLIFYMYSLFSCSAPTQYRIKDRMATSSSYNLQAKKFPEVRLYTTNMKSYTCKLISLKGNEIALLPSPYWNIEAIKLDLNKIHSIQLEEMPRSAGHGFAGGFAAGFMITGIIGGIASKYDEDYKFALLGAAGVGLGCGIIGLIIGAASDATRKTGYEFHKMNRSEKILAIKNIMGL
jgi:hypothetical protein